MGIYSQEFKDAYTKSFSTTFWTFKLFDIYDNSKIFVIKINKKQAQDWICTVHNDLKNCPTKGNNSKMLT